MTGTVGAVIRIREPFPSKRALFDIGVAGPIAGFLALLPFLYWGITLSRLVPANSGGPGAIYFGEPLLYKAMAWLHFGRIPDGLDVSLHPMAFAAWWGMLATALNLLPFGQLDGGHIIYALAGRRSVALSIATLATTAVLTFWSVSWVVMTLMMAVMAVTMSFRHPPVPDQDTPLDPQRKLIALVALIIFVICFTPTPIKGIFGQ
jgi:membrane-associated protease RseP (regulator of RpoE activity)